MDVNGKEVVDRKVDVYKNCMWMGKCMLMVKGIWMGKLMLMINWCE